MRGFASKMKSASNLDLRRISGKAGNGPYFPFCHRDWMGDVKTEDGTWRWRSGDPMDNTTWCTDCPDTGKEGWDYSQLLKHCFHGTLYTFYLARETIRGSGGAGGSSRFPCCVFHICHLGFVMKHSRQWRPPIGGSKMF